MEHKVPQTLYFQGPVALICSFMCQRRVYTLKKEQPDLMLVHLTDVDTNRHLYGVDCEPVREALKRHDERLGELMETGV